jgi:transcriptional regulator with XRE-family HTH domain
MMTRSYVAPSPAAGLLQLARIKAGLSQRELAERAAVPATMISAYERDRRQPTLATLLRLLKAAGFELRMRLEPYDPHDEVLEALEAGRSEDERSRRDEQIEAWRRDRSSIATGFVQLASRAHRVVVDGGELSVADLDDVIRSKEAAGRPKDLRVLPALYRHRASRSSDP